MSDDKNAQEPQPAGQIDPGGTSGAADGAEPTPAERPAAEADAAVSSSESPRGAAVCVCSALWSRFPG